MAHRRRLAQRRETLGYTQLTLAKCLRVQRSTVVRWETGSTIPQPWVRPHLSAALEITPEQLDSLLAEAGSATEEDHPDVSITLDPESGDMKRRELLRHFSLAGAFLALPQGGELLDAERLERASDRPGRVDESTLEEFGKLNTHLWQVFALSSSKSEALPMVRHQLDVLTDSLRHPQAITSFRRLCALVADLLQLAGEIYFDGNDYTEAAHSYTLAASASQQAEEFDLWAVR